VHKGAAMITKVLAVALLFGAWTLAAMGGGDDAKKELDKLQGVWKLEEGKIRDYRDEFFIIKDDCIIDKIDAKVIDEFRVKIVNPTKNPKEIDLIPLKDPNKGIACPAIYKVEGNKLTICVRFEPGSKRPTDFTSNQTNRNIILIMVKVEAKQK
jgi:uncharacterized protein (TIGR03067 family)